MKETKSFVVRWRDVVLDSDVGSSARLVALVLSTHMNAAGGSCYPGQRLLERETRLARNTVASAINELEAARLLGVERGRGRRANSYTALMPNGATVAPSDEPVEQANGSIRDRSGAPTAPEDVEDVTTLTEETKNGGWRRDHDTANPNLAPDVARYVERARTHPTGDQA